MFQQQRHEQPAIANERRAGPAPIDGPTTPEVLRNVVVRHHVCYEVWPEWSGRGGCARRIGYCVTLCGVNGRGECVRSHHVPGCQHCGSTYDELRKIAEWITLTQQPDCRIEIEPFDRAWHIAPGQRWSRNEIAVNVKVMHCHNVDGPVDDSQERSLKELRANLKKLGVREGVWQPATDAAH